MERLIKNSRGATTIEYSLLAALVIILITSGVSTLGENLTLGFDKAGAAMASEPEAAKTDNSRYLIITENEETN